MDDNATVHWATTVEEWFSQHDSNFNDLAWPPQNPDLNSIGNVLDMLEKHIRQRSPLPYNLSQLKDCLVKAWYVLHLDALQYLMEFMPDRIHAVLLRAKE